MSTRPRPTIAERPPLTGLGPAPSRDPLAVGTPGALAPGAAPMEENGPLPLDPATIALSLPIAISLGQLNVPAAAGWAALLLVYKAVTAPGVGRGTLDFLVDGLNIDGDVRARLGVPPRAASPRRRTTSPWSAPVVAVRGWQAAVAARREGWGGVGEGGPAPAPAPAPEPARGLARGGAATTGTTTRLPSLGSILDTPPATNASASTDAGASVEDPPMTIHEAVAQLPAIIPLRDLAVDPRPLAVPLGTVPSGDVRWVDLGEDVVNVGVYGTTGAGKDLLLLQWFVLLCRRNRPEEVQFIVLDGKGDWLLPQLKGLAHMRVDPAGGYGNVEAIKHALDTIHQEARTREQLIFGSGHRSREHYIARTGKRLPLLMVVVTDLMTTIQGYVEEELAELISKARALGIRVVMSFQNPTGKDMGWRSNIGLVLAGCMVDGSQDPVVLGIRRIQDMYYRPSQLPNPKRSDPATKGLFVVRHGSEQLLVKTPYMDDDALLALCARLPRRSGPTASARPEEPEPEPEPPAQPAAEEEEANPLLAALLQQALPPRTSPTPTPGRARWPKAAGQPLTGGRRRPGFGAGQPRPRIEDQAPAPAHEIDQPAQEDDDDDDLPPLPAITGELTEDDRLYRMMCVPLGFNQIIRAIGSDRSALGKRCMRIRQERGLGPWPTRRPRVSQRTLVSRMAAVPMGFNEIRRALAVARTPLSELYQEITGRTERTSQTSDTP